MDMVGSGSAALWERFHSELFGFLTSRGSSEATAQDILQTAMLRAHEQLLTGKRPDNPRAWMYQIVRNLAVDAQRRSGRQRALAQAVASDPTHATETSGPDDGPFAVVARSLPMFIAELEEPLREALRLTEIEGLTQAEAAARVGISVSGMKSRVARGKSRVFEALTRCCEFKVDARGRMIDCHPRSSTACSCE